MGYSKRHTRRIKRKSPKKHRKSKKKTLSKIIEIMTPKRKRSLGLRGSMRRSQPKSIRNISLVENPDLTEFNKKNYIDRTVDPRIGITEGSNEKSSSSLSESYYGNKDCLNNLLSFEPESESNIYLNQTPFLSPESEPEYDMESIDDSPHPSLSFEDEKEMVEREEATRELSDAVDDIIKINESSGMFNDDMELRPRTGFFGRMALFGENFMPNVTSTRNFTMNKLVPVGNVVYNQGSKAVDQNLSSLIRSLGFTPQEKRKKRHSLERPGGCKIKKSRRRKKR